MPPENVKLVLTDVDGVLTDGVIGLDERGEEFKHFCVQDGLGVRLLQAAGIPVGFVSSRESPVVQLRAENLGVRLHRSGVKDKGEELEEILRSLRHGETGHGETGHGETGHGETGGIEAADVCYIGDDLLDLPCFRRVGFPVAVANAREEVKSQAEYVTRAEGGHGAFREVAELILKAHGLWAEIVEKYR